MFKQFIYITALVIAFATYPLWLIINWIINWLTPTYENEGIYAVVGRTGSGKSLFKTYLEMQEQRNRGVIVSNVWGKSKYLQEINMTDIWEKGETKYNLNGSGVDMLSFDEVQLDFDNRDFKDKSYKECLQPLAKMISLHRHLKVRRVFFFTQSWESLDIKLRRLCHYVIDIDHSKKIDIPTMVERRLDKNFVAGRKKAKKRQNRVPREFKYITRIPSSLHLTVFEKADYEENKEYFEQVKKGFFDTKIKISDLDRYKIRVNKRLLQSHNTHIFEDYYIDKPIYETDKAKERDKDIEQDLEKEKGESKA